MNKHPMTDDELIAAFEVGTPPEPFHHVDHVKLAWTYLRRHPVIDVLTRLPKGLRALATARGKPDRYHETITWAYIFLLRERMAQMGPTHDWADFVKCHPDLLDWNKSILRAYYGDATLRSDLARDLFVLPDRADRPVALHNAAAP